KFAAGLSYDDFLTRHGTTAHRDRWRQTYDKIALTPEQRDLLASFTRQTGVFCLAGAWCGDCSSQCPIYRRFEEAAPVLKLRFLDRDEHADAQRALQINGGDRVPVVVFFSEDGYEVSRFGERTLSRYRQMARDQVGASCPTGVVPAGGDPLLA